MSDEQRREARGPRRVFPNPLGWGAGCIAGRMQTNFWDTTLADLEGSGTVQMRKQQMRTRSKAW